MGTFCFVFLILRNPPMEIREIVGIYVVWVVVCLGFWGSLPSFFTPGKKLQFWAKLLTRFSHGGLLFLSGKKYENSKRIGFVTGYLTIFTPNLVGVG